MNSQIAVRGSMIMNYLVVYCSSNNLPIPNLIDQALLYQAFASYNSAPNILQLYIKDEYLLHVVMETIHFFPPPFRNNDGSVIEGKGWLIDYLCIMYTANIKASIKGKWKSIINNTIDAHLKMFKPDLSAKKKQTWWKNIFKRIT